MDCSWQNSSLCLTNTINISLVTAACNFLKVSEFLGKLMEMKLKQYNQIGTTKIIYNFMVLAFFVRVTETNKGRGKADWTLLLKFYFSSWWLSIFKQSIRSTYHHKGISLFIKTYAEVAAFYLLSSESGWPPWEAFHHPSGSLMLRKGNETMP